MKQYLDLLSYILERGTKKENRTGINTISTFAYQFRHDMPQGFPILTTKKVKWENIVFENLWFLGGNSSWDFLHKHGITFWDAWDEGKGQLPEAYGEYWRKYPHFHHVKGVEDGTYDKYINGSFDQIAAIITRLKTDRDNRRLVLTNWYPPSAYAAKLPPCHLMSIFNTQYDDLGYPKLCCHTTIRSADVPVGTPYNVAGYGFILSLVAHLVGLPVGELIITLVDAHIYENQIGGVREQLMRKPTKLPLLQINNISSLTDIDALIRDGTTKQIMECFKLIGYEPQSFIKLPVAV